MAYQPGEFPKKYETNFETVPLTHYVLTRIMVYNGHREMSLVMAGR